MEYDKELEFVAESELFGDGKPQKVGILHVLILLKKFTNQKDEIIKELKQKVIDQELIIKVLKHQGDDSE